MMYRRSTLFGAMLGANFLVLALLFIHAGFRQIADVSQLVRKAVLVRKLGLSDLCLFTEASYTRHLSLADLRTPFQEYPMAIEHFPSGSLAKPPLHLTEPHAAHD